MDERQYIHINRAYGLLQIRKAMCITAFESWLNKTAVLKKKRSGIIAMSKPSLSFKYPAQNLIGYRINRFVYRHKA